MIRAEELRIGNLALMPSSNAITTITVMDISDIENGYKNRLPIPLTEEWLVKFGFEEAEHEGIFRLPELPNIAVIIGQFIEIEYKEFSVLKIKCDYVHELQNFFSCLKHELITK